MSEERNTNCNVNDSNEGIPMSTLNQPHESENDDVSTVPAKTAKQWKFLVNLTNKALKWRKNESALQRSVKWQNRRIRLASRCYGGIKNLDDSVDNAYFLHDPKAAIIRKKPSVFQYAKEALGKGQRTDDVTDSASAVIINAVFDRDETPREFGVGLAGEVLQREYADVPIPTFVRQQMDEMEDYRPYFSYWVTTVQLIIMIITMSWYSIAPIGVEMALKSDFVFTESLTYQQVAFYEPSNFWIGPKPADVIHLGAVFAPCMVKIFFCYT